MRNSRGISPGPIAFQNKTAALFSGVTPWLPRWLSAGLLQVAGTSQLDKTTNKLEFRVDDWEREQVREAIRTGTSTKPRDLMKMVGEDFAGSSGKAYWQRHYEAGTFTRFLCAGAGAKDPRTKDLLRDYIRNLKAVTLELDAAEPRSAPVESS